MKGRDFAECDDTCGYCNPEHAHQQLMTKLNNMTSEEVFQTSVDAGIHNYDGSLTNHYEAPMSIDKWEFDELDNRTLFEKGAERCGTPPAGLLAQAHAPATISLNVTQLQCRRIDSTEEFPELAEIVDAWPSISVDERRVHYRFFKKMGGGSVKYGPLKIKGDPRNFKAERRDEIFDLMSYTMIQELRDDDERIEDERIVDELVAKRTNAMATHKMVKP